MVRRKQSRGLGGSRVYKGAIRGRQNGNPGECRDRDPYWVEVSTSQGDVYHINPNVTQVREFPSLFLEAHWAMAAAYLVLFVMITVVLWRYTNRRMGL